MKSKLSFCIMILLGSHFFSCQESGPTPQRSTAAFLPLKVYEIPFDPFFCYFSPLQDGKIWLTNNDISCEFDPATGKFIDLVPRLGDFAAGMDEKVFSDEYNTNLIWICNFHKGLMVYDKPKGTSVKYSSSQYFNGGAILMVKPEKELVWISTSNGIYRMNRSDWKIDQIVKTDIWASNIQRSGPDDIIFGRTDGSYYGSDWCKYKISTNEMQKIPCPALPNRVEQIIKSIKSGVDLNTRDIYEIDDDIDVIWFINNVGLGQIDKKTGTIKYVDLGCQDLYLAGKNHAVLVDKSTLWVRYSNKLISIDKNQIAGIIVDRPIIEEKIRKINDLKTDMWHEQRPVLFFKKMIIVINLYDATYKLKNNSFESVFSLMEPYFVGLCHRNIPEMEKYLQINSTDTVMAPFLLYGLMCGYSLNGYPGQALEYYGILAQKYPAHKILRYIRPEDIQTLKKGTEELGKINAKELAPDQKLWEVGQAYMQIMRVDWNMGEGGYHMNYPFTFFTELLQQYPKSSYADNAWWMLYLSYSDWDSYDMFMLNTMLPIYKEFLIRYPSSELAPQVKYSMSLDILNAVEYAEENSTDKEILPLDKRRAYLDTARQMCKEAIQSGLPEKDTLGTSIPPTKNLSKIEEYLKKYEGSSVKEKN